MEKHSESEKTFVQQVDAALNGKLPIYTSIKVCDTPQILLDVGCRQLPMLYTQRHLRDAIKEKNLKEHTHGLTVEQIKRLPKLLSSPVMIMDSIKPNSNSIVLVTSEFDRDNFPVFVSIAPNGSGRYLLEQVDSNFITSVYGRNNFQNYLQRVISSDSLLYCNKERSQKLLERWGEQYSELTNSLDFNTIIHKSRNIINTFDEKFLLNEKGTKEMGHPQEKPAEKRNPWSIKTMSRNAKKISENYEKDHQPDRTQKKQNQEEL